MDSRLRGNDKKQNFLVNSSKVRQRVQYVCGLMRITFCSLPQTSAVIEFNGRFFL